jgi:hypothetical protein
MYPRHTTGNRLYGDCMFLKLDYMIRLIKPSVESWPCLASMNNYWSELCNTK